MKHRQFSITIKIIYEKEASDAPYVAYIPEFDVSSCGKTEEQAVGNVKEALDIVLEEVQQQGKLNEFLKDAGFSADNGAFQSYPKLIIEPFIFPQPA